MRFDFGADLWYTAFMLDYVVIVSSRKTMALEVSAEKGVIVRAPRRATKKEIESFVLSHAAWIERAKKRVQARAAHRPVFSDDACEIARLKNLAKEKIPPRVAYYAALLGVTPAKIGYTKAKTRFGSCSGKNSINFSCYLMLYSDRAIDYVVVHELCHIRHKNHSKAFYEMIAGVMPDYKEREKELKGL